MPSGYLDHYKYENSYETNNQSHASTTPTPITDTNKLIYNPPSTSSNANAHIGHPNPLTVIRSTSDNISSSVGNVFEQPKPVVASDGKQQASLPPSKLTGMNGGLWSLIGKSSCTKKADRLFSVAVDDILYVRE